MPSNYLRMLLVTILATVLVGSASFGRSHATSVPQTEITVSAAISLKDVLDEIVQLYRVQAPDTVIHFNLGASGTLERQIEQGALRWTFSSPRRRTK